ncbi:MAG: hypothetical protein V4503_09620 [Gemmatimonadota bacterium]
MGRTAHGWSTTGLWAVIALLIGASPALAQTDTLPAPAKPACGACPDGNRAGLAPLNAAAARDTIRQRPIEYSPLYNTALTIHRVASYAELPLFVAEYFVGTKLLDDERKSPNVRSSLKGPHSAIAAGLGVLFTANTATGLYTLIASRKEPAGRTRRWIHAISMLVADAGFVATAGAAESARESDAGAVRHRNLAIGSMGLAMASTVMMWVWRD